MNNKILEINNYDPYYLNKVNNIFEINEIENTINIINNYNKNSNSIELIYHILEGNEFNNDIIEDISNKYKELGFILDKSELIGEDLIIYLSIPNNDLQAFKYNLKEYLINKLELYSLNIDISKLLNIYLYKIFEIEDLQLATGKNLFIKNDDFNGFGLTFNNKLETLDNKSYRGDYYNDNLNYSVTILVLLILLCDNTLSGIKLKDELGRIHGKDIYDYLILINKDLQKRNIIDLSALNKEMEINNNIVSIKINKDKEGFILEKEYIYYGEYTKYIDLVRMYPQSKIISNVYFGKTNKYTVIEKIKLSSIDL